MSVAGRIMSCIYAAGDILLPRCCHLCDAPLMEGERSICQRCAADLPRTLYHREDMNPMAMRFAGFFPFRRATGFFFYAPGSSLAQLFQDFKYRGCPSLARDIGRIVGRELIPVGFLSDTDVIVPVPIHWWKRAKRGYNQSEMIARGISAVSGIPVDTSLVAARPHRTQTSLSHEQRESNTAGVFSLRNPARLRGKHILLIDDVCTTGATLRSAAMAILDSFPSDGSEPSLSLLSIGVTQI